MRNHLRLASVLLLSVLIAPACSHQAPQQSLPEQNSRLIYPSVGQTKCARIPAAPAIDADDAVWALYHHQRDDAGDDCRDKLDAVDGIVSKWPRTESVPK